MENKNLTELMRSKWFDNYQKGLESRFSADGMTYDYHYEEKNSINSVVVSLRKGEVKTRIELVENGNLNFYYSQNNEEIIERFENCSDEDFHTMLAHSFIYIRDGNFDYHKEWYSKLEKESTKHNKT